MTRLKNAGIYNVKGSVELSFPEDTPVYTPINIGQESLCRHQEWTITNSFRWAKQQFICFICISLDVSEV